MCVDCEFPCYSILSHAQVLLEYWKEWRRSQADPVGQFKFSKETIHGKLSIDHGEGWKAYLVMKNKVRGWSLVYRDYK